MTIEEIKEHLVRTLPHLEALRQQSYEVPNTVLRDIPEPLVSVRIITFQHAAYLRRCVESILAQRTNFPFEVLIGEDFSTDGTRELAFELARAHPGRIRLITADRNVGVKANGFRLRMAARGRYTALCEGDDQWIDPDKLQMQVDILERDPGAVGCFTDAWNERDGRRSDYISVWLGKEKCPEVVHLEDIIGRNFIPTASMLYRTAAQLPLNAAAVKAPLGDQKLHVNLLRSGHYRYLPRYTSVREVHAGGIISMKDALHKLEVNIRSLDAIAELLEGRSTAVVHARMAGLLAQVVPVAARRGEVAKAKQYLARLRATPGVRLGWRRNLWFQLLVSFPRLMDRYLRFRKRRMQERPTA